MDPHSSFEDPDPASDADPYELLSRSGYGAKEKIPILIFLLRFLLILVLLLLFLFVLVVVLILHLFLLFVLAVVVVVVLLLILLLFSVLVVILLKVLLLIVVLLLLVILGFRLCPGSGFISLHMDPDTTFLIQIRIHKSKSVSASLDPAKKKLMKSFLKL